MSFGRRKIPKRLILDNYCEHKRSPGYGWLILAAGILIVSMFISVRVSADIQPGEAQTGQLMLKGDDNLLTPSLHLHSSADVAINGMIAKVTLTQVFSNTTQQWREGIYVFPLPENAAVNHMQMRVGDHLIIGEIKEKNAAKNLYRAAKKAGKRAALTEQLRPNLFSQRVANIGPLAEVEISITYLQTVSFDEGEFSWRMPMTITPRFSPAQPQIEEHRTPLKKNTDFDLAPYHPVSQNDSFWQENAFGESGWLEGESAQLDHWLLPASLTQFLDPAPINPMQLQLRLNSGLPLANIESVFQRVDIDKIGDTHHIRFSDNTANMDRDFVLRWQPTASSSPKAALFSEEIDNEYYSLLMVLPPQKKAPHELKLARDVVFIIDVSGSMSGTSIAQAKAGLIGAIDRLNIDDRFNIVAFSSNYHSLFPSLNDADEDNLERARRWVSSLRSNGGTNMLPALDFAFSQYSPSHALKQTIFITDGAVSNEAQLFTSIRKNIGDSRLFTVGIGSAPNTYFMHKAAAFGRGTFTHIGNIQQVEEKIHALFTKLDGAVATDIRINWPGNVSMYPHKIPDLYLSEPLLIAAKSSQLNGQVDITGETAMQTWQQSIGLSNHKNAQGISSLWARAKIEDLEDNKISGGNKDAIKAEIIDVALRHKLLSHYTSFVAIEQKTVRDDAAALLSNAIQNALPAGFTHTSHSVAYPATATNAEITWWLGLFCLFVSVIVWRLSKDI